MNHQSRRWLLIQSTIALPTQVAAIYILGRRVSQQQQQQQQSTVDNWLHHRSPSTFRPSLDIVFQQPPAAIRHRVIVSWQSPFHCIPSAPINWHQLLSPQVRHAPYQSIYRRQSHHRALLTSSRLPTATPGRRCQRHHVQVSASPPSLLTSPSLSHRLLAFSNHFTSSPLLHRPCHLVVNQLCHHWHRRSTSSQFFLPSPG